MNAEEMQRLRKGDAVRLSEFFGEEPSGEVTGVNGQWVTVFFTVKRKFVFDNRKDTPELLRPREFRYPEEL